MTDSPRQSTTPRRQHLSRARSLAAKFPGVPLGAWPHERRLTLLLLTALLWSAAMLFGGAVGAGLIG